MIHKLTKDHKQLLTYQLQAPTYKLIETLCLHHMQIKHTVDSLLFVGYQFSWISRVKSNQHIKCSTNNNFSIGLCANNC